jgi:hypothetical protein
MKPIPVPDIDDDQAENAALAEAVAEARASTRVVSHEEMSAWLLKIAAGDFDPQVPVAREVTD